MIWTLFTIVNVIIITLFNNKYIRIAKDPILEILLYVYTIINLLFYYVWIIWLSMDNKVTLGITG